jgi:hypothetical protein
MYLCFLVYLYTLFSITVPCQADFNVRKTTLESNIRFHLIIFKFTEIKLNLVVAYLKIYKPQTAECHLEPGPEPRWEEVNR